MCDHKQFIGKVNVTRLTDNDKSTTVTGYRVDLFVHCQECGLPFEFIGVPGGYNPNFPTVNFNGTELRCPIKPSNESPDIAIKNSISN